MRCEDMASLLAATGGDTTMLDPRGRAHVEGCLRCQAEVAQYRRLLKALHNLRTEVLAPSPGLVTDVLARLEEAGERTAVKSMLKGRRVAYAGGIAVAAVGAAGGAAIVLASRRGRRLAG